MKIIHKMNIRRILRKQDGDSMVCVKSDRNGFIWAGRAKFAFNCFRNEFFHIHPKQVIRSTTGGLVIVID